MIASPHYFNRLHIPSGTLSRDAFNASHHEVFADPLNYGPRTMESAKLALVNRWNHQQPTEWKYWI